MAKSSAKTDNCGRNWGRLMLSSRLKRAEGDDDDNDIYRILGNLYVNKC